MSQPLTTQVASIAACLPEQFIWSGVRSPPARHHGVPLGVLERVVGRRLEGGLVEPGRREDPAYAVEVERLPGVRRARQRQELGRQVEAEPHHRQRLERLVARPRQDRLVDAADRPVDGARRGRARRPSRSGAPRRSRIGRARPRRPAPRTAQGLTWVQINFSGMAGLRRADARPAVLPDAARARRPRAAGRAGRSRRPRPSTSPAARSRSPCRPTSPPQPRRPAPSSWSTRRVCRSPGSACPAVRSPR